MATVYDAGGLVRRVARAARPNLANLDSLVTRMGYDPAGRKVADTATDGAIDTYQYDPAGHLTQHFTRDTLSVGYQYDAIGELTTRTMSARTSPDSITFDTDFLLWAPLGFASQIDVTATYTYDVAGRQITADNATGNVTRSYLPNGALLSETIDVNQWDFGEQAFDAQSRSYVYDLDGRKRATHGLGGDTVAVDAAGRMTGIADLSGHWFHYQYDSLGRPNAVTYPNNAHLTRTYDAEDRVTRRIELDPTGSTLHNDTLTYDARGKVTHALGTVEEAYEGYSALGTLWASTRENVNEQNLFENDERFVADAMGNVVQHTVDRAGGGAPTHDTTVSVYAPIAGRLIRTIGLSGFSNIAYTAAGERDTAQGVPSLSSSPRTGDRYYYRPDGLLIAVDHRSCILRNVDRCEFNADELQFEHPTGAFEEYRYDALGRRVLTRTVTDSVCGVAPCGNAIMEVVFDGNAIAAEIRSPLTVADSVAAGEARGIPVPQPPNGAGAAFYGTVEYLNGPEMDKPLEIQNVVVYRTWRAVIDSGQCLSVCGIGNITYPGHSYEAYLSLIPSTQTAPTGWHGSLFDEGMGDGGLMYRRNRYYDPNTGQFTQEDPLGLAGGMNAYGFAAGDPVNFNDPFGLCVDGVTTAICIIEVAEGGALAVGAEASALTVAASHVVVAGSSLLTQATLNVANDLAGAGVDIAEKATTVHGNSLLTTKLTQGYTLRDLKTNEVLKYGQTTLGKWRYTQAYLKKHNAYMRFETSGTKPEMRGWEHTNILDYKASHDGRRPELNKSDY